ncbi:MAG: MBL fold metallo-hydrolase [Christensenellaceae bacterium]|jgi:competence protein ComEC|nr:MBL fold metallo-hydrolase [Christensenellaceae bacterium]
MLKVDFINVGDGDAILLRCAGQGAATTVLVDCGRPYVEFTQGSLRGSCLDYLMREKIEKIDLLVLTHPHLDHIGGALSILHHIQVAQIVALYLPPEGAAWIHPPVREEKPLVGLCDLLNLWNDTVIFAKQRGSICREAQAGSISLGGLQLTFYLPDAELIARQKALFHALYRNEFPPNDVVFPISKERNCSSLLLRVVYAGKSILLTGDSYASYWQSWALPPCDILKVPHHGDGKSMTEPLIRSLHPEFAVISCQNDPTVKKDRPNVPVLELLLQNVPHVLCTENRELPGYPAATREAVRFLVEANGGIACF